MNSVDTAVIKACIKQDTRAEYVLYKYCFALLMPVCYRYAKNEDDAADMLNKAFLKILTNLGKYEQDKSFEAWAKRITVNTLIDEYRSNKLYKETMKNTDMNEVSHEYHPIDYNEAESRISSNELKRYINKLPDASKLVLNLYVFDGLSHKEIAGQLQISEGTSKWHLSNARSILKKMMADVLHGVKLLVL